MLSIVEIAVKKVCRLHLRLSQIAPYLRVVDTESGHFCCAKSTFGSCVHPGTFVPEKKALKDTCSSSFKFGCAGQAQHTVYLKAIGLYET
jgi:hypothetical protein